MSVALAFPWGDKVAQVRFTTPEPWRAAEASLVCSSGATYASVYVACSCVDCSGKPLQAFRNGGNILSLEAWARHARVSTDEIQVSEYAAGLEVSLLLSGACGNSACHRILGLPGNPSPADGL